MKDLSKARIATLKINVTVEVEGEKFKQEMSNEVWSPIIMRAIRHGRKPTDALSFLATVGSNHLSDPGFITSRVAFIGDIEEEK